MKLQKVTSSKAADALIGTVEAGIGFGASNAVVNPVDSIVKNKKASKVIVAALGLGIALTVPNKHAKAVGGGMAAKQIWDLGKEAIAPHVPQTGIIADALEIDSYPSITTPVGKEELKGELVRLAGRRGMGNPNNGFIKLGNAMPYAGQNNVMVG